MPDPLYRSIAEDLREKIEAGILGGLDEDKEPTEDQPGGYYKPLPSEGELGKTYNASRNTIRDAIKWLANRRLIETRPGQGTFVVRINPFIVYVNQSNGFGGEAVTYASATDRQVRVSDPRIEIQQATEPVAAELELDEGSSVLIRHQERFIDETPWSMQTTIYPMSLVTRGATRLIEAVDIRAGTVAYLEETLGIKQLGFRDELKVRAPDVNEVAFFKLPEDGSVAVFETRRTGFTEGDAPLRLTVTVFPADRNQFVYNVGHVPAKFKERTS